MEAIINDLKSLKKDYEEFIKEAEEEGTDSFDPDQLIDYGFLLGAISVCQQMLEKYDNTSN